MVNIALPIAKALYPRYSLLFLFNNITSYFIYTDNTLYTKEMNKRSGGKQIWLRSKQFKKDGTYIEQPINY